MAHYQRIEYPIGLDGNVIESVLNGQREQCLLATEELERGLGPIESRELLPEFHADHQHVLIVEQSQSIQQSIHQ